MAIIGTGQLSLLDLNDAIIAGTAPTNPTTGTLWIDSSTTPNILKKWNGSAWVEQPLDLEKLDPEFTEYVSEGVSTALTGLGNLSSDDKVTASERQVIADKLVEILGSVPSGTTALPAVATVNTYTTGEYYQARRAATDAGVSTGDATYMALATAYTTLQTYLNGITDTGSYLWDVSTAAKDKVHTVVGTTFRSNWQAFYNALLNLQTRTAKRVSDAKSEAQAYAESYSKSYRSQLVANGFGDMASNKNFSAFVYDSAQKVTGPGSFRRGTAGATWTDEYIRVEADRTYRLSMSVMSSTTSNTHNFGIECYNAAGTSVGVRHVIRNSGGTTVIPSTTSWVHYEAVIGGLNTGAGAVTDNTFPAGTTQVRIFFNLNNGGVANNVFIADVSFALEQIEANKDYNGITMSADKGLVVESSRNTTTMSATKGIEIKRKSDNVNVFSVDANTGNLNITGNINMVGGQIAWDVLNAPSAEQVGAAVASDITNAVNAIEIGGTNLLRDSDKFASNPAAGSGITVSRNSSGYLEVISTAPNGNFVAFNMLNGYQDLESKMKEGETFTVSFEMMSPDHERNPSFYVKSGMGYYNLEGTMSSTFSRLSTTQVWRKANGINFHLGFSGIAGTTIIKNIKFERGNKATSWTPAPEDTQSQLDDFKTLTDKVGTTTVINGTMVQSGTIKGDFIDAKNIVVRNGSNVETFKVDSAGNVSINGTITVNSSSNVYAKADTYSKVETNTAVKNSTDTAFAADQGLAMKIGYSTYSTATASNIYFHGFNWDTTNNRYVAADVNGKMLGADNITFVTLNKGRLNLSAGVPAGSMGFIVYDSGTYWYVVYDKATGTYTRYNNGVTGHNTVYTFSTNSQVVGELEM